MPDTAYATLAACRSRIAPLDHALAMLGWDESVLMPEGSGEARSEAVAGLSVLRQRELVGTGLQDALAAARAEPDGLDDWQQANLAAIDDEVRRATAVPEDLLAARVRAIGRCQQAWQKGRPANDWAGLQPLLQEVLERTRDVATAQGEALGCAPYDALLSGYQPGLDSAVVAEVFGQLEARLPPLLEQVLAAQQPAEPIPGPFPVPMQAALGERLVRSLGFDLSRGRLDTSKHPFCGGVPDDCRITTRYREDSFVEAMMGTLHETGHGLYEQGLPRAWRGQPVGEAAGMAVHESQSLLMEMQACRSRAFVDWVAPVVREAFGATDADPLWSADNLHRHLTRVERGYIRVDADEVTYPLHVVLRFRLEQALLDGSLPLADLPGAWDDGLQAGLGLSTGDNHRDGCLQDIHWYAGLFGYFPTYTLGAMAAAQLYAAARRAEPDLEAALGRGEFAPLVDWLRREVHGRGRLLGMQALLEAATGSPLDPDCFLDHLQERYLPGG